MKKLPGIYRDIHPDREPVNCGRYRGRDRVYDVPSDLMRHVREQAEAKGHSLKRVLRTIMRASIERMEQQRRRGGAF